MKEGGPNAPDTPSAVPCPLAKTLCCLLLTSGSKACRPDGVCRRILPLPADKSTPSGQDAVQSPAGNQQAGADRAVAGSVMGCHEGQGGKCTAQEDCGGLVSPVPKAATPCLTAGCVSLAADWLLSVERHHRVPCFRCSCGRDWHPAHLAGCAETDVSAESPVSCHPTAVKCTAPAWPGRREVWCALQLPVC